MVTLKERKQLKRNIFWVILASFGQLVFINDPHVHFQTSWNKLNDHKGQKI